MAKNWKHRRDVGLVFVMGMLPLPLLLFWSAGLGWSLGIALAVALPLALFAHLLPIVDGHWSYRELRHVMWGHEVRGHFGGFSNAGF